MHQLIEGLKEVDVADDFVVYCKGHTDDQSGADHDINMIAFLNRARQHHIVLSKYKATLRERSADFISHMITPESLIEALDAYQGITGYANSQ